MCTHLPALFFFSFLDFSSLSIFGFVIDLICFLFVFIFQWDKQPRLIIEAFVLLLSPYAPHMAEELWFRLGHSTSLAYEPFPEVYYLYLS